MTPCSTYVGFGAGRTDAIALASAERRDSHLGLAWAACVLPTLHPGGSGILWEAAAIVHVLGDSPAHQAPPQSGGCDTGSGLQA